MLKYSRRNPRKWQLQQAKQSFSKVVKLAETEGPQLITKSGTEAAWLISADEYHRMTSSKRGLVDFFQNSPHRDVEIPFERRKDLPRQIEL